MRSSLATALMAWSMLTGLGLVFAQLTQLQGFTAPGHPEVRWAYPVFDGSLALSVLVAGLGGLPLWLLMLRRAWRERRPRDTVYLLLPLIAPATYLAALVVTTRLLGRPNGVGPWWFLVVTLAGFAAAATAAAGPGLALRRLQPRGPALRLAAAAAGAGRRGHGAGGRGHRGRRRRPVPVGARLRRLPPRHHLGYLPGAGRRGRDRHYGQRRAGHPCRAGEAIAAALALTAAEAAVKMAARLGVRCTDPVILADGANVIVYLSPAPVVAKVAASTPAVRPGPAAWLQRELDVTRFLAGRRADGGASRQRSATMYHEDGQVMSSGSTWARPATRLPRKTTIDDAAGPARRATACPAGLRCRHR